jgi:hypothetical protein
VVTPPDDSTPAGPDRGALAFYGVVIVVGLILAGGVFAWRARTATPSITGAPPPPPPSAAAAPPWVSFTPPEGGFRVELPATPTAQLSKTTLKGTPAEFHEFTATRGGEAMSVSYVDLDPSIAPGAADATKELAEMLNLATTPTSEPSGSADPANAPNPDVTTHPVDGSANPALDYTINLHASGEDRGRMLLIGSRLYNLQISAPAVRADDLDHLVSSFHTT